MIAELSDVLFQTAHIRTTFSRDHSEIITGGGGGLEDLRCSSMKSGHPPRFDKI